MKSLIQSSVASAEGLVLWTSSSSTSKGSVTELASVTLKKRSLEVDDWRDFILCLQDWNKAVSYLSDLGRKVIANMLVTPIGATRDPR